MSNQVLPDLLNAYEIQKDDLQFFLYVAELVEEHHITDEHLVTLIRESVQLRAKVKTTRKNPTGVH